MEGADLMPDNWESRGHYEGVDRVYVHCGECKGWTERWDVQGGPTLPGRSNHLRTCSSRQLFHLPTPEPSDA